MAKSTKNAVARAKRVARTSSVPGEQTPKRTSSRKGGSRTQAAPSRKNTSRDVAVVSGEVVPASTPHNAEVEQVDVAKVMRSRKKLTAVQTEALARAVDQTALMQIRIWERIRQGEGYAVTIDPGTITKNKPQGRPFSNFGAYCRYRFSMSHESAYRFLRAGEVVRELETKYRVPADTLETTSVKQFDELKKLAEKQPARYDSIVRQAEAGKPLPSARELVKIRTDRAKSSATAKQTAAFTKWNEAVCWIAGGSDKRSGDGTKSVPNGVEVADTIAMIGAEYEGNPEGRNEHVASINEAVAQLQAIAEGAAAVEILPLPADAPKDGEQDEQDEQAGSAEEVGATS